MICNFSANERGITIEYGLIVALIAIAIVAAMGILGTDLTGIFASAASSL